MGARITQPIITGQSAIVTASTDISNDTGDWADIDSRSITLTTKGGNIYLNFCCSAQNSVNVQRGGFRLNIDGTPVATQINIFTPGSDPSIIDISYLKTDLAAGSHTFKAQWKDISGKLEIKDAKQGTTRHLLVIELPKNWS